MYVTNHEKQRDNEIFLSSPDGEIRTYLLPSTNDTEMVKNKDVIMRFRKEIDKYNASLGDYEQVKKFEIIAKEWTIESGEMTASLKPRRSKIMKNYSDLIDKIYAE